jgi:hypothetical protein
MIQSALVLGWLQGALPVVVLALTLVGGCASSGKKGLVVAGAGSNMTSSVDKSRCDEQGKQVVTADTNGDQRPDVTKIYTSIRQGDQTSQVLVCKQVDLNSDGKVDIIYHYGEESGLTFEEFDLDFDGRFDLRAFYQSGRRVREELDTNYDQRVDFTKYYEADRLVRVERDGNNDGRVDEWQYYEAGKLDRIGFDSTGSGRVDRWERASDEETATAEAPAGEAAASASSPAAAPASTTPVPN